MRQTLFPLLVNAPWKRDVEIGEGTHMIMREKNRGSVSEGFLTEPEPLKELARARGPHELSVEIQVTLIAKSVSLCRLVIVKSPLWDSDVRSSAG
jgi:hypothetical protein